ncbi:pentapeptide repeat-containing protein [Dinoroseobacter sp. S124A]|uniref:pentapeptide repeat-containing protein n=1 Tax=Dinoroseobacter sp. S124A TaxID=3415128 RepID=UPI003C7D5310
MSDKRKNDVMTWLGLPTEFNFATGRPLGRILGWGAVGLYGTIVLLLATGLIVVVAATLAHFVEVKTSWEGYRWSLLTIATLTATLGAAIALPMTILKTRYTQRQTVAAEQNLITDRINQAVAGLGAEKVVKVLTQGADGEARVVERSAPNIEVRVGAILSLERISISSPPDHVRIMEILCAYVRENACIVPVKENPKKPEDWKQRTDTQMALTVIGRRGPDKITLEQARGYALDLRGADVQLADMSEGAWQKARLSDAVMARALLFNANLQEANLWDANLQQANLWDANLQEAKLGGANLQEAGLWDANLQEADLGGANLQEADLGGANLQEAKLGDANLQEAKLGGANLQEAKLGGANLQQAKLGGANLQEAKLGGANLQQANLWAANLQEANLGGANLQEANLGRANLQEASLGHANLQEAKLGGANLQEANLWSANLQEASLGRTNLQWAKLWDAKLNSANLRNWTIARTFLRSAEFTDSQNLSQESVNSAFGVASGIGQTVLPDGVTPPEHWHIGEDAQEDSDAHLKAAWDAYQDWLASLPEDRDDTSP